MSRRRLAIIAIVVAVVLLYSLAGFYTDLLWFDEVGYQSVLLKSLATQFLVGVVGGVAVAAFVAFNLAIAGRGAPRYGVRLAGARDPFEQQRDWIEQHAGWTRVAIGAVVGSLVGIGLSASWRTFLLWTNRVPFGTRDPQFGKDVGFYVFELPFYDLVLNVAWFTTLVTLLLVVGAHFFHGGIQPGARLAGIQPAALAHISALLALLALLKAAQYVLGTYELNFSPRGVVTGASYTDVHAQLQALRLLAVISVISAGLFVVNISLRRISLPLAAVGIWIVVAVLAGAAWPWAVQRFSVEPQEPQRERPFIQRNITATRAAFGLSDVTTRGFAATQGLSSEHAQANETLLQNVRLWDPDVLATAYQQLQAIRTYYQFPDVDVDRYEVAGQMRQVLLSARELDLNSLPEASETWSNLHLQFTHGFGLVASLANESTTAGQPSFLVKDVPGTAVEGVDAFDLEQPRVYYGESFEPEQYSIVNTEQPELDFPVEGGAERNSYDGSGGVPVGGLFKRLMFALRESDPNLVLSGVIEPDSKMLLYRDVRDRVRRVAPFLELDHDPYTVALDGRLIWVLDAYTSTRFYPYSQRFSIGDLVADTEAGTLSGVRNYIRNSVKVTVDAYDGTMKFYIVDENDPLVRAWQNAFPVLFTDEEPSDELRAHFRYPEDLFKVQSEVYRTYHMSNPVDFYQREDEWDIATTLDDEQRVSVDPTYLLFRLPGESEQEFVLTRPFTPHNKNNMISLLVARSDPDNYGEVMTLQFPRSRVVSGPSQVSNVINQDVEFSQLRTLLGREGSEVEFGSLVILPIEESLLYVQPVFVIAEDIGIPELKKVLLVLGERVVIGDSFDQALAELFGLEQEEQLGLPEEPEQPEVEPGPGGQPQELEQILQRAARLYERAQAALERGDFEEYGRLIEELGDVLEEAERR